MTTSTHSSSTPHHGEAHRDATTRSVYRGRRARSPQTGRWRPRLRAIAVPLLLGAVVTASAPGVIRIKSGDTLWDLARAHHTTVAAIEQANHLHSDRIYAGQLLKIPGTGAASPARGKTSGWGNYTVQAGDSVIVLARQFRTSRTALISTNHLRSDGFIRIGQHLRVPKLTPPAPAHTSPLVNRHRALLASRHQPSRAAIRTMVAATARRYGVDPSLTMSIALQESGFQPYVVSSADAIGVMQLLPSTGAWLSQDVVGRRLNIFSAQDNITGGVILLKLLLRATSLKNAVGAYYQGLGSIQRRGMFNDTKAYVNAVLVNRRLFH